ncbi:MAG: Bro-N domain-containing protein [Terrimicrobiaceae bacterium]
MKTQHLATELEGVRTFDFHGTPVRLVENSGDLWFCVLELMQAIDDKPEIGKQYHPTQAVEGLDDDEVRSVDLLDGRNVLRPHLCVTRSGMWAIVNKSKGEKSQVFRRWMRKDVLKSIDEKGSYSIAPERPAPQATVGRRQYPRAAPSREAGGIHRRYDDRASRAGSDDEPE